jgi:hypothetical protein
MCVSWVLSASKLLTLFLPRAGSWPMGSLRRENGEERNHWRLTAHSRHCKQHRDNGTKEVRTRHQVDDESKNV